MPIFEKWEIYQTVFEKLVTKRQNQKNLRWQKVSFFHEQKYWFWLFNYRINILGENELTKLPVFEISGFSHKKVHYFNFFRTPFIILFWQKVPRIQDEMNETVPVQFCPVQRSHQVLEWSVLEESHLQFLVQTTSWGFLAIYIYTYMYIYIYITP